MTVKVYQRTLFLNETVETDYLAVVGGNTYTYKDGKLKDCKVSVEVTNEELLFAVRQAIAAKYG